MKATVLSILVVLAVVGGIYAFSGGGSNGESGSSGSSASNGNVTMADGKQIVEINVRGGYFPRVSVAKAGVPTILRFKTSGTFDCSSYIHIPSLGVTKALPQTGVTDIDIGNFQTARLQGTCGMGMYSFEVDFQSP